MTVCVCARACVFVTCVCMFVIQCVTVCVCVRTRARACVTVCDFARVSVFYSMKRQKTDSNLETQIKTLLKSVMFPAMKTVGASRLIIRGK